jgi:two-component system, cell cycle sensor histidine kinase and response regulator CckA
MCGVRGERLLRALRAPVIVSNARPAKLPPRARSASIVHSQSAPVTTDLTRAAVDEALRRHSLVFSTIGDGVLVMDLEGRIIDMNPGAERLFGYTKEELLGQHVVRLHHPSLQGNQEEIIQAALRRDGRWEGELHFQRKDGSDGIADVVVVAQRDEHGTPNAWIGVNRDITARRRAEERLVRVEEELRQSQKMDAIGQLAGGVAHDFNNLLTVIKAYSGIIADQLDDTNPLKIDVGEIQRAAGRASSLTQQLLAFSRKQVLQPRVLDLNTVSRELEPMLRRLIGDDIQVVLQLDDTIGRVKADRSQVEQVLINLIVNARDAMPSGGTVSIETANVELSDSYSRQRPIVAPGRYVMIAVSDTGEGMDEATQSRIFEPFFTTKPAGKGTGLGLSTVYGIVKQSNGYIWVYSEPRIGTTFKVYLPLLDAEEICVATAEHAVGTPGAGSETVLLVEDEPSVRSIARRILERNGYTVLEAHDGRHALRVADQYKQPIQLLLTDMMMPELTGRDVWVSLAPRRSELRVLYMSGYTNDDIVRRGLLDAGAAFLQKPFTAADLARAVRSTLDTAS